MVRAARGRHRHWWLLLAVAPLALTACAKQPNGPLAQEPTNLTTYSPGPPIASPLPSGRPSLLPTAAPGPTLAPPPGRTPTRTRTTQPATHTSSPKPKPKPRQSDTAYVIYAFDYYFAPSDPTVPVGATVRFVNQGPSAHTWTSNPLQAESFDSGQKDEGENDYTYTFTTPGTYNFYCRNHSAPPPAGFNMTGSITVQ